MRVTQIKFPLSIENIEVAVRPKYSKCRKKLVHQLRSQQQLSQHGDNSTNKVPRQYDQELPAELIRTSSSLSGTGKHWSRSTSAHLPLPRCSRSTNEQSVAARCKRQRINSSNLYIAIFRFTNGGVTTEVLGHKGRGPNDKRFGMCSRGRMTPSASPLNRRCTIN